MLNAFAKRIRQARSGSNNLVRAIAFLKEGDRYASDSGLGYCETLSLDLARSVY
ncbi:MAG: hypothetical protein F6K30_30040 [Cyanothece sp. SIO2G6]|nr:hypothetical protein [Cyanothece sp. SIO2G6]